MKKVLSAFLVTSVLLLCAAPVFSLASAAPFSIRSTFTQDYIYNYDCDFSVIVSNGHSCYFYAFAVPHSQLTFDYFTLSESPSNSSNVRLRVYVNRGSFLNESFTAHCDEIDLVNGTVTHDAFYVNASSNSFAFPPDWGGTSTLYFFSPTNCNNSDSANLILSTPFVSFARSSSDYIYAPFSQPTYDPYHSYFADSQHFYMITSDLGSCISGSIPQLISQHNNMIIGSTTDGFRLYDAVFPSVMQYAANSFKFILHNSLRDSDYTAKYYISVYDISTGQLINSHEISVSAGSSYEFPFYISEPSFGYWCLGMTQDDSLYNIPLMAIRWSDTIDYSSQLNSMISLLQSLYSDFVDLSSILSSSVPSILTYTSNISGNTSTIASYIPNIYTKILDISSTLGYFSRFATSHYSWFESTFYDNLNQKWTFTNNYLVSIYNLLNETDETMTIDDDTSGAAAMESAKNDLVVTNAAGQTVDAGQAAAEGLSQAAQQIGEIAQPVSTINTLMQSIVFSKPKLLLPVIVALGLGLMVTILGKNKSD